MKTAAFNKAVRARIVIVAVAAVALAGCSTINPITSQKEYEPSDGVHLDIGDSAEALNLLVLTTAEGAPAVLTGSLHNAGSEDLTVSVSLDAQTTTDVEVPAYATVALGTAEGQTVVQGTATAAPGLLATVLVGSQETGLEQVQVPVLDGTIHPYDEVLAAMPPMPVPSTSPSPED